MFHDIAALHCFVEWDKSKGVCRSGTGPGTLCRLPNCWRNTKWESGTTMWNKVEHKNKCWTKWNHNVRCSCFPGWRFPMISLWPGKRQQGGILQTFREGSQTLLQTFRPLNVWSDGRRGWNADSIQPLHFQEREDDWGVSVRGSF